jgi:hypothetical protein
MKVELTCLVFIVMYAIYAINGNKPILFVNFWRSYLYTILFALPMMLLLWNLNDAKGTFALCIRLSTIIILAILIIFNLSLINATDVAFRRYCTYEWLARIIALFIAVLIGISFLIKYLK